MTGPEFFECVLILPAMLDGRLIASTTALCPHSFGRLINS